MDEKGEGKGCKRRRRVMGPFKGVRMRKWGKWVSEIRVPRTNARIWLGSYDTPEKAARAYDAAVYCLQGLKRNFNFPGDERLGISGGSFNLRLKEEIQEIAARFASGGCMSLPPSASSAPYINSPQMLVTTPINSSDMVITTPIHSPERATTLMNSQEVLITTFMKQPDVLVRTFIRPPEVPLTNFMEPPQVPVTVFINPSQVPITTSVKLSEIPVPPKMLVTTSMNPPEVPVLPQMLVTTSMNLPKVRVSPEVMTPSLDPQLVSIKVDDIGHTCEGSYSHLANISEPDGFSPDSFLLDEPFDPDSTSSISDEAKGDMK